MEKTGAILKENKKYEYELSVVMPCLNEHETIGICVEKAMRAMRENNINGEVVIADNGSTDGSQEIAKNLGARIVDVEEKGYGSALQGGIKDARGKFIIMGDSDDSYDFLGIAPFVEKMREGYDLVMGNRFKGGIKPGAMPFLHKWLGNPVLSFVGRLFFNTNIGDFHCGLRGFTKEAFNRMDLRTKGMEFASEIVVKATLWKMRIAEVPTTLSPDGRSGRPHLRSFRDGWRHLRFLLLYSPRWLFLYPGLALLLIGFALGAWLLPGSRLTLDIHTMLYASASIIIGFHMVSFAVLTKTFAMQEKLLPVNSRLKKLMDKISLEAGIIIAILMILIGLGGSFYALYLFEQGAFTQNAVTQTMRIVISSITFLVLGFQVALTSFFYSILKLKL